MRVDRLHIKPSIYSATVRHLDSYERYNPSLPAAGQRYNRRLVRDNDGLDGWTYVAGSRKAQELRRVGKLISSGDYTKRY